MQQIQVWLSGTFLHASVLIPPIMVSPSLKLSLSYPCLSPPPPPLHSQSELANTQTKLCQVSTYLTGHCPGQVSNPFTWISRPFLIWPCHLSLASPTHPPTCSLT